MDVNLIVEGWVLWTLLAASMQAVRTAGQKQLSGAVTPITATLVRYLFGLPFALLYLAFLSSSRQWQLPDLGAIFYVSGLIAGVLQIAATFLLIRLFSLRNFAVGTTFVRTEILLTALIGVMFFTEEISSLGWVAIMASVVGLVLISVAKQQGIDRLWDVSAVYGLAAGLAFALTSLFLRQASLSLGIDDATYSAAITLVYMVVLQTAICLVLVAWRAPSDFRILPKKLFASSFIGVTSVMGSVGWFTAMTLQSASYVKTLGQVEFIFTLLLSVFYFKERPSRIEWAGMTLVILGAVLLLLI